MVYARPNLVAGMHWLRPEFAHNLQRARDLVEQYVEERASAASLREAVSALQEVGSSAQIVQCAGVAIAAAEIADAVDALSHESVEDVPALGAAVMGALMQLDDYADAVVSGLPDHALVLHPALNELHIVRGQPLLSESEIFARQVAMLGPQMAFGGPESGAPPAQPLARKYETVYQQALASWLRDEAREGVARVGKLSEAFARGTDDADQHMLWRCMAATAETVLAGGLDGSLDLKRLLGRSAHAVRALAAGDGFAEARQLAGALLLHLGRADRVGPRTQRLRERLELDRHLPEDAILARMRNRLRGTNSALIAQLSQELRADLGKVKDHIDLRVRAGAGDMEEARALLDQMAHTLSMLGLPALARVARNQISLLSTLLSEEADAGHEGWIDIASALLRIEVSLDEALYRNINAVSAEVDGVPLGEEIPNAADLQGGQQALVRESQVNISRVKTAVDAWMRNGNAEALADAEQQLQEVAAALAVISETRFAELVSGLAALAREQGLAALCDSTRAAERFADAIAVIDFYLESLLERRAPSAHLADALGTLLDGFGSAGDADADKGETDDAPAQDAAEAAAAEPVDPDIREVFLEEAEEVRATIESAYARWQRDPDDTEAMLEVRRGFHTLKGSGRMVGATDLGEFAWACEQLLNACRDGGLAVTPAIVGFVGEAVAFVPEMVAAFADPGRTLDRERLEALSESADRLLHGGTTGAEREDLLQTFLEDAVAQIGMAGRWLERRPGGGQSADPDVIRAFHTLRGSAAAVGAERFSALAGGIEHYLNTLRRGDRRLEADDHALIAEIVEALRERVAAREPEPDPARFDAWMAGLRERHERLPASEREDAEAHAIGEAFCIEALEWLQAIDEQVRAWRVDPAGRHYAPVIRDHFRNLGGTAANADCELLAAPARALVTSLETAVADDTPPTDAALASLERFVEALFQRLDAYREHGALSVDDDLVARVEALDWQGDAPPPAADAAAAFVPEPAEDEGMPGLPMVGSDAPEEAAASEPDPPAAPTAPAASASTEDDDAAELRELFIGEAQELLEAIDSDLDRLERQPGAEEPLRELARSLHTFKGSARMAGYNDMGEVAHRCETLVSAIEDGAVAADTAALSRLHNAADGLYRAVEQLRAGREPDVRTLLEDLDDDTAADAPGAAPADALSAGDAAAATEPEGSLEGIGDAVRTHPPMDDAGEWPAEDAGDDGMPADAAPFPDTARDWRNPDDERLPAWTDAPADDVAGRVFTLDDGGPVAAVPPADPEGSLEQIGDAVSHHPPMEATEPLTDDDDDFAASGDDAEAARLVDAGADWREPDDDRLPPWAPADTGAPPAAEPDGVDAELLSGFHEEARDLLETIEGALERWSRDADAGVPAADAGAVTDFRRALHTLKGSARMVDATSMAAVAHEMESMADDLVAGHIDADSSTFMQLQTRLEQLQHLHAGTRPGHAAPPAADDDSAYYDSTYIDELTGGGEAAPAAQPVDDLPVPATAPAPETQWDPRVLWRPPEEDESLLGLRREFARVPVPQLEGLLNQGGEISVLRARLDEQNAGVGNQLDELGETVNRLRDQLRQLNAETEAQIEARGLVGGEAEPDRYGQDFDPLEMDRYSRMQELSRALAETVGDINVLQDAMRAGSGETEALLLQQQRITSDLQQGLMGTLMVPFARQTQRLQRVVRQTAQESGKQVRARFEGEDIEVDRNVLERMTAPLEHALRNAVVHGIEDAATRDGRGKPELGTIDVHLAREGQQLRLTVADDGGGLDLDAIRRTAIERGLMTANAELSQAQLALFILEPGFSTARELTQTAGRGVGMDVLAAEVRQLGGSLEIDSQPGSGTRFVIRLPISLGLAQALMFEAGGETFAVPITGIEGIGRVPRAQAAPADGSEGRMQYGDTEYRVAFAADYIGLPRAAASDARALPAVLLRLPEGVDEGSRNLALVVDHVIGNREVVSKTIGPVLAAVPGMSGATILPDGRIVLLLDLIALVQDRVRRQRIREAPPVTSETRGARPQVMVVDDSITMRRVAERLLERNGFEVVLARDGVDAMGQLATLRPDVVLLDIEMPRADGFEVASYMRNTTGLAATPIIMITSRSGDKHRARAAELGVQRYLIKPYQEAELLDEIRSVREEVRA